MADKMMLTVTLRKEVPDRDAGKALYDIVKQRMADKPDVDVRGHVANHFDLEETPP